ncbi:MAG: hypothetical protein GIKADHBN_01119 [Phycisphaerales bacterium]|nr:hypothetical protein [Phycisphaerales bacterium]
MNSFTSRPRSPIRAMTLTSASERAAIVPSSVLFPTPGPAKMPIRWPLPRVVKRSTARTPVCSGWVMRLRASGWIGRGVSGIGMRSWMGPLPSMGRPRPSTQRPSMRSPTGVVCETCSPTT